MGLTAAGEEFRAGGGRARPRSDYSIALEMREAGMKWRIIGERFGVTVERARQMAAKAQRLRAKTR
jgi:hypothetical protein